MISFTHNDFQEPFERETKTIKELFVTGNIQLQFLLGA